MILFLAHSLPAFLFSLLYRLAGKSPPPPPSHKDYDDDIGIWRENYHILWKEKKEFKKQDDGNHWRIIMCKYSIMVQVQSS